MKILWFRNVTKLFLFLAVCTLTISLAHAADNYIEGEALVVLKNKVGTLNSRSLSSEEATNYISEVATQASAKSVITYSELSLASNEIIVLMRTSTKSTEELIAELKKNPDVVSVSPNYKMYAAATKPNDAFWKNMWNMELICAPEAWEISTGKDNIYVAVLDSGIDARHEDLSRNIDRNLSRSFVNPTGSGEPVEDQDYDDKSWSGHGTHISGTIAAVGNNREGVAGVIWNAKIIALRVMTSENWTPHSYIIAAIDYLVELLKDPNRKIVALNLSVAGWHDWTPMAAKEESLLWRALHTLNQLNRTVIVVAAGNAASQIGVPATVDYPLPNCKGWYCYPASYIDLDNMIVVGAIDLNKNAGVTSNWSSEKVHLVAPGVSVFSTLPVAMEGGYGYRTGTSKSAPHVAGAAALVAASSSRDLTAREIRDILFKSANSLVNPESPATVTVDGKPFKIDPQGIPTRKLSKYGLLNVGKAVALSAGVPYKPNEPTPPKMGGGGCNAVVFGFGAGALILAVLWGIRIKNKIH